MFSSQPSLHSLPFPLKGPLLISHQHSQGNANPSVSWELTAVTCTCQSCWGTKPAWTWHFAKGHLPSAPKRLWRAWDAWQSPCSTLQAAAPETLLGCLQATAAPRAVTQCWTAIKGGSEPPNSPLQGTEPAAQFKCHCSGGCPSAAAKHRRGCAGKEKPGKVCVLRGSG